MQRSYSESWASTFFMGDLYREEHVENVYRLGLDIKTAFDIHSLTLTNSMIRLISLRPIWKIQHHYGTAPVPTKHYNSELLRDSPLSVN